VHGLAALQQKKRGIVQGLEALEHKKGIAQGLDALEHKKEKEDLLFDLIF